LKILTIIPARGGSKGIPKKNVRLINNKPLISYSINTAKSSSFDLDVVVSTDDDEIIRISEKYGAVALKRPSELASDNVTLDPVIYHTFKTIEDSKDINYDYVITMQPTSPLLSTRILDEAIEHVIENDLDTLISGVNTPHLSWTIKNGKTIPNYEKRLNRQQLPKHLQETGAFVITKRNYITENSRFGNKLEIFELPSREAIDIDTPQDWWIAEKELTKKMILIRVEGYAAIGLGHIYRGLLLANHFIDHEIRFIISEKSDIGIEKIKKSHFNYDVIKHDNELEKLIQKYDCDILINDMLDTTAEYMELCSDQDVRTINFEDLGEGAKYADAVINDLYEKSNHFENHFWGSDYYCIRDEFLIANPSEFNQEVEEVLILFGGTDPSNLTNKLFECLKYMPKEIHFTFILGLGYKDTQSLLNKVNKSQYNVDIVTDVKLMTEYMSKADIAISSQGRTMLELASMLVPTILLAQNERETTHEFGHLENGFINLGLGHEVEINTIKETLLWLIKSPQIRKQMQNQMKKKNLKKGLKRVIDIILDENL